MGCGWQTQQVHLTCKGRGALYSQEVRKGSSSQGLQYRSHSLPPTVAGCGSLGLGVTFLICQCAIPVYSSSTGQGSAQDGGIRD